jgi:hypothetical protein
MKQRIGSPEGRQRYRQRIGTVEPVFGNLRHNKRLNRFTLRRSKKVGVLSGAQHREGGRVRAEEIAGRMGPGSVPE